MTQQTAPPGTPPLAALPVDGKAAEPPADPGSDEGVTDQTRRIVDGVRRLVQAEVELAKAEIRATLRRFAIAVVLMVLGLLVIFYGSIWLLSALPQAFGTQLLGDLWKAFAVYGALFFLVGGALGSLGFRRLRGTIASLKSSQTAASIKENLEWGKGLTKRADRSS